MPIKEDTETRLLRALSNTPLQVDCSFLMLKLARFEKYIADASE